MVVVSELEVLYESFLCICSNKAYYYLCIYGPCLFLFLSKIFSKTLVLRSVKDLPAALDNHKYSLWFKIIAKKWMHIDMFSV
jgi:hypothetical protein